MSINYSFSPAGIIHLHPPLHLYLRFVHWVDKKKRHAITINYDNTLWMYSWIIHYKVGHGYSGNIYYRKIRHCMCPDYVFLPCSYLPTISFHSQPPNCLLFRARLHCIVLMICFHHRTIVFFCAYYNQLFCIIIDAG